MLTRFGKFSLTLGKLTLQIGHELLTCWRASSLIFADLVWQCGKTLLQRIEVKLCGPVLRQALGII
jgi:hypothetical protein